MPEDINNPFVYSREASLESDSTPAPSQTGITLRDKFAGQSPWPIPDWFKPSDMPEKPYEILHPDLAFLPGNDDDQTGQDDINAKMYEYYDYDTNTWDDDTYKLDTGVDAVPHEFKDAVALQRALYLVYISELEYWQNDYDKERYFQWRWYYADEMLIKRLGGDIS